MMYSSEYAKYNDHYYGTPKDKINEKLDAGIDVILVIEIQGALKVKRTCARCHLHIYLAT